MLRRLMKRADALTAGLACGRERRKPTASEIALWYRDAGLRRAFDQGRDRGRRQAASLEQLRLVGVA